MLKSPWYMNKQHLIFPEMSFCPVLTPQLCGARTSRHTLTFRFTLFLLFFDFSKVLVRLPWDRDNRTLKG